MDIVGRRVKSVVPCLPKSTSHSKPTNLSMLSSSPQRILAFSFTEEKCGIRKKVNLNIALS